MALFLLLSVPIWLLLVVSFYKTRDWIEILRFFLGGLCIGMVSLLITLGLLTRVPFKMDNFGLFWWAWIRGTGLPMFLAIPVIFIVCVRNSSLYSRILEITVCLGGVVVPYNIWQGLMQNSGFYVYRFFISPFVWIGTIALIAWLLGGRLHWDRVPRYLLLAICILLPSVINLLPLIYIYNRHYLTWIISVAFAIVANFLVFLDSRD